MVFTVNFSFRRSMLYPFWPAEWIFKWGGGGGLLGTRKRVQNRGDPRAPSPRKMSNLMRLKWL